MSSFVVVAGIVLLLAAAALQIAGKRRTSVVLLILLPAFASTTAVVEMSKGALRIGGASYEADEKELAFFLAEIVLSVAAFWLSQWRWLFWLIWLVNAAVCGALVYLAFFWKVFS